MTMPNNNDEILNDFLERVFTNYQETKEHYPEEEVTYANCMREIAADYKGLFGDAQKQLPIEIKVSLVDNSLYL